MYFCFPLSLGSLTSHVSSGRVTVWCDISDVFLVSPINWVIDLHLFLTYFLMNLCLWFTSSYILSIPPLPCIYFPPIPLLFLFPPFFLLHFCFFAFNSLQCRLLRFSVPYPYNIFLGFHLYLSFSFFSSLPLAFISCLFPRLPRFTLLFLLILTFISTLSLLIFCPAYFPLFLLWRTSVLSLFFLLFFCLFFTFPHTLPTS